MSGSIEKLTAAIEENTAALKKMIEMSRGEKTVKAGPVIDAKAEKAESKAKPAARKKGPTLKDVSNKFTEYLGIKDADERERRKEHVRSIVEYFGVARATAIKEDDYEEALGYLQQYADGETPSFDGAAPVEEAEEEDSGELV